MRSGKPVIRPATSEDIEKFSPERNKPSIRALCIERDGEILALGGVARMGGRWFAFSDIAPEARQYRVMIARGAIRIFESLRRDGFKTVYAQRDDAEPMADKWMRSLGFKHMRSGFYKWQP